ncbi:MAG: hypothetical protein ACJ8F3_21115 [Xanthobacteraceae bacterium]
MPNIIEARSSRNTSPAQRERIHYVATLGFRARRRWLRPFTATVWRKGRMGLSP